jgi:glycyl-tRNA synthetase beta chain
MSALAPHNTYLLEVGTEELPAGFLASAPQALRQLVTTSLADHSLAANAIEIFHTPRRLTLYLTGLPNVQPDSDNVIKGPPLRIALDATGQPTPAGFGFAKKMGVDWQTLQQDTIEGEAYWVLKNTVRGQSVQTLLQTLAPQWILGLSGSHFMRWADWDVRFSRPIRWVLSLWNSEELPVTIGPVVSGRQTWGHRVLGPGPWTLATASDYVDLLKEFGKVWVNPAERQALILEQLAQAGLSTFHSPQQQALLETVSLLVEHPSVLLGQFNPDYLTLPPAVIETVMSAHQKYFALPNPTDPTLLQSSFLVVTNGDPVAVDTMRAGNERVLAARLADAQFFFTDDQKRPLADLVEDLKGVTFQKDLGSMFDKTQRLVTLIDVVAYALKLDPLMVKHCTRAALLSKADLVTGMVRELTELQGEMGTVYAKLNGEPEMVTEALWSQYSLDAVLSNPSIVSQALYLADQLDTLVAVFAQSNPKLPTGSKDPIGLRRAAYGALSVIIEKQLPVNLTALLHVAYNTLHQAGLAGRSESETWADLYPFILQRLKSYCTDVDKGAFRPDVFEAVLYIADPLTDLNNFMLKVHGLTLLLKAPTVLEKLEAPANRIAKILGKAYDPASTPDDKLLLDVTEQAVHKASVVFLDYFKPTQALTEASYPMYTAALAELAPLIEAFFEKVLVNDPNEAIKANRYALLSVLHSAYRRIADFSKLVTA